MLGMSGLIKKNWELVYTLLQEELALISPDHIICAD